MPFEKLSSYLSKFKSLAPPDDFLRTYIAELITEELGIHFHKESVEISRGIIYIKEAPIIKNEIFLRRGLLLKKINEISKGKITTLYLAIRVN